MERKAGYYRSRYRSRKQVVEPVFGQINQARGFRQFLKEGIICYLRKPVEEELLKRCLVAALRP
jgi:hypothetical protein